GRKFSAWGSINYNDGHNSNQVYNDYRITDSGLDSSRIQNQLNDRTNRNFGTYAGISYMEPLWEKTFIEFNYNFGRNASTNNRSVYDDTEGVEQFNSDLSNEYDFQFVTNKVGMNYSYISDKLNYTIDINAQPTVLKVENNT